MATTKSWDNYFYDMSGITLSFNMACACSQVIVIQGQFGVYGIYKPEGPKGL